MAHLPHSGVDVLALRGLLMLGQLEERFKFIPTVAAFHHHRGAPRDQRHGAYPATIAVGIELGHVKPSSTSSSP
jgi:hypothetical protein